MHFFNNHSFRIQILVWCLLFIMFTSSYATPMHDAVRWYNRYCLDSIWSITANSARWAYLHLYASCACLLFILLFTIFSSRMQQRMRFMELCNAANNIFNDDDDDDLWLFSSCYCFVFVKSMAYRDLYSHLFATDCRRSKFEIFVSWMLLPVIDLVFALHVAYASCLSPQCGSIFPRILIFFFACFAVTGRMADTLREVTILLCSMDFYLLEADSKLIIRERFQALIVSIMEEFSKNFFGGAMIFAIKALFATN